MPKAQDFINEQYGTNTDKAIFSHEEAVEIFGAGVNDRDLDYTEIFDVCEYLAGHEVSIKIEGKEISFIDIMARFHILK